jgi:hypothetical protein
MPVQLCDMTARSNRLPERIERKFYILPMKVDITYGLLRSICRFDFDYPAEQINSLYFDTVDLDQYNKSDSGDLVKNKVRIRWYGQNDNLTGMQTIYLELKSRRGFASTKQRLELKVPAENLALSELGRGIVPNPFLSDTLAKFGYFVKEPLRPVIIISYWRYRFNEVLTGQRVSLDCHIRSSMIASGFDSIEKQLELPGGVMEIKGLRMDLPITLRMIRVLELDWSRFSKYASCIDAHVMQPGTRGQLSPSGIIVN